MPSFRLPSRALPAVIFMVFVYNGFSQSHSPEPALFNLLPPARTGITFSNRIIESDSLNILRQANIYNGGGVGIGDFNNDGLQDIFLSGNMTSNKLYLNRGGLKFEDITDRAGVGGDHRWCTGVSVVDINGDGRMDIYVSASFRTDANLRTNLLYINQGPDAKGIPVFKESAAAYGIADTGFSTQGVFFDFDHDGDLDLYLVTNQLNDPKTPIRFRPKIIDGSALNNDRLYRNDGNGIFTNITKEAGILIEGWGHAACISDFNQDGWPDIYVSNDFVSNDLLYINNHDGTFTNRLGEYFMHTGWNAMGTDVADIDNDGLPDLVSLEMLPENNLRKKRMLAGNEYYNYFNSSRFGYTHQYVRNVLQLNRGMSPEGHPVYSEIGFMAGIYETDWSWCPLVADFDNDGFRDIIITNGLPRDVTDLDYVAYNNGQGGGTATLSLKMTDALPVVRLPGYAFKNKGDLQFSNMSAEWGFTHPSFSNGAAYADLDNDGDLDLVINNINDPAFIYENTLYHTDASPTKTSGSSVSASTSHLSSPRTSGPSGPAPVVPRTSGPSGPALPISGATGTPSPTHWLALSLRGEGLNRDGIGANIRIWYGGGRQQYYEHQPTRGYMSTDDYRVHFGLGSYTRIDSLRIQWPDGRTQLLTHLDADQLISCSIANASTQQTLSNASSEQSISTGVLAPSQQPTSNHASSQQGTSNHASSQQPTQTNPNPSPTPSQHPLFTRASDEYNIHFRHQEKDVIDYNIQPALPHKLSQYGPGIAVGDIDNNGFEDFYIGASVGHKSMFFLQDARGSFSIDSTRMPWEGHPGEDMGLLLFDADNDGDLDLYVVSGSYELQPNHSSSQDILYFNDGQGHFTPRYDALPKMFSNGSAVRAIDFDGDGDLDLFVAGRVTSGAYPTPPASYLLENHSGSFFDVTKRVCPELQDIGMVTDALWSDFDGDGHPDLILTGEWMPITFFHNVDGRLINVTGSSGIAAHTGWWNSLVAGDFDNDGDIDYIAGNLGLNSNYKASPAEPMICYAKDLDDNGLLDAMVFCYMRAEDGSRKPFPMSAKDDMASQMIGIRKKFPTYKSYGLATMDDLWSAKDKENALSFQATDMASSYIENLGGGKFAIHPLPIQAQIAPVYGMIAEDINGDGNLDLLLVGNDYGMEPYSGRHDASMGLYMEGSGNGRFTPLPIASSGFYVKGDAKALSRIHTARNEDIYLATRNQDSLIAYRLNRPSYPSHKWLSLQPADFSADLLFNDGRHKHTEFYYGSSYLSQSSRTFPIPAGCTKITITDTRGIKRDIIL